MKKNTNKPKKPVVRIVLLIVLTLALLLEVAFVGLDHTGYLDVLMGVTEPPATISTEPPTQATDAPTEAPTQAPTEEPTEPPTEPQPEYFTLTFVGDCTLGSTSGKWNSSSSFVQTIGENYDFPFANVVSFFENDDFTMANLEGPLTESGTAAIKTFAFRGPTAYTQILTGSSVEAVTLANNHAEDYGQTGYESTTTALTEAGVAFVEKNGTCLYTTESGLTIGLYAGSFSLSESDIKSDIAALREAGAEIVVCAFHWGNEGSYRPNGIQQSFAHIAIDAGADIVYGHHPHVLQPIEYYGNGVIYYSLGNFSFGGNVFPRDYDSAVLQQQIIRDVDGTVRLGELTIIPCSISSMSGQNNYQPTPYEVDSDAYNRALSKLDGTFTGPNLVVDYSTTSTEPAAASDTAADTGTSADTDAPAEGGGDSAGDSAVDAAGAGAVEPGAGAEAPAEGAE